MKRLLILLTMLSASLFNAACAGGDGPVAGRSTGSMTMYGTLDTGVTMHN
ncbi:MAG: hypothetical protein ACRYGL_00995 [Janthinobacterium lividum]